jgi:hypothetical protein
MRIKYILEVNSNVMNKFSLVISLKENLNVLRQYYRDLMMFRRDGNNKWETLKRINNFFILYFTNLMT